MFNKVTAVTGLLLLFGSDASADTCPPLAPGDGEEADQCRHVLRLRCEPSGRVLTGFRSQIQGESGIVTALHGVAGCARVTGGNLLEEHDDLAIYRVDAERDVALLRSRMESADSRLEARMPEDSGDDLRVIGYPQGIFGQFAHPLRPDPVFRRPLFRIMDPEHQRLIERRTSPKLDIEVLSLVGSLQPGYSGAPIVTESGRAIGVANGGLGTGSGVGWAIPIDDIDWQHPSSVEAELNQVAEGAEGFFAAQTESVLEPLPPLIFTDARDRSGQIYKLENDSVSRFFQWDRGTIYSIATTRSGSLLFSNHNDSYLYAKREAVQRLYRHDTYLRDVESDPLDRIYFSEASGAGGDGAIYRLDGGTANHYYTVRLSEVDGSWAGNFAFDPDGSLWLSSGNHTPAHLYKVEDGRPVRKFSSPRPIRGFSFVDRDTLVYADWKQKLYRLSLPDFSISAVQTVGYIRWMGDVEPLRSRLEAEPSEEDDAPSTMVVDFEAADIEPGILEEGSLRDRGISEIDTVVTSGGYCHEAEPAVLPPRSYNAPRSFLSTASPGNLTRCNTVLVSLEFTAPVRDVRVQFFGADVPYELTAFRSDGSIVDSRSLHADPYVYDREFKVAISVSEAEISRIHFGHQSALTMIRRIELAR